MSLKLDENLERVEESAAPPKPRKKKKKPFVVTLNVNWQEYNYIHQSLWCSIREYRADIDKFGREHGNVAYLHDYCVRVHKKIERMFEQSRRAYLGDKEYIRNRRFIKKLVADMVAEGGR